MQPTRKYLCIIIDGMDQSKTNIPQVQKVSKSVQNLKQLRTHITGNIDKGIHALKVDPVSFNFTTLHNITK